MEVISSFSMYNQEALSNPGDTLLASPFFGYKITYYSYGFRARFLGGCPVLLWGKVAKQRSVHSILSRLRKGFTRR